jgi:hypothetical protein
MFFMGRYVSSFTATRVCVLDAGVQNPTTLLADDVAVTRRMLAAQDGPAILVGHFYGGIVITEAGTDPKAAAPVAGRDGVRSLVRRRQKGGSSNVSCGYDALDRGGDLPAGILVADGIPSCLQTLAWDDAACVSHPNGVSEPSFRVGNPRRWIGAVPTLEAVSIWAVVAQPLRVRFRINLRASCTAE